MGVVKGERWIRRDDGNLHGKVKFSASTSPSLHLPSHGVEERTRGVQRGEKIVAARLRRRGCSCLAKSLKREKNTSWGILRVFQGSPLSL